MDNIISQRNKEKDFLNTFSTRYPLTEVEKCDKMSDARGDELTFNWFRDTAAVDDDNAPSDDLCVTPAACMTAAIHLPLDQLTKYHAGCASAKKHDCRLPAAVCGRLTNCFYQYCGRRCDCRMSAKAFIADAPSVCNNAPSHSCTISSTSQHLLYSLKVEDSSTLSTVNTSDGQKLTRKLLTNSLTTFLS